MTSDWITRLRRLPCGKAMLYRCVAQNLFAEAEPRRKKQIKLAGRLSLSARKAAKPQARVALTLH
jgi:hypothetical protein